jgi:hypothetical protein
LSSTAPAIDPVTDPVTLKVGTFSTTIPPGSFKKHEDGDGAGAGDEHEDGDGAGAGDEHEHEHEHEDGFFTFHGDIDGVKLKALIKPTGTLRYAFFAKARDADLTGTTNPVTVMLTIGNNSGTTSVKAHISPSGKEAQGGVGDN